MAHCSTDDQNTGDQNAEDQNTNEPIVIPMLQTNNFNFFMHDRIYHEMQTCMRRPMKKTVKGVRSSTSSNQPIWSPARELTQEKSCASNLPNVGSNSNVNGLQTCNTDQNTIHPHTITSNSDISDDNISARAAMDFMFLPCNASKSLSALDLLAKYSQKLLRESEMEKKKSEVRQEMWPTYSKASDIKS